MAAARLQPEVDETAARRQTRAVSSSSAASPATEILNEASHADPLEIHRNIRLSRRDFQLFLVASESDEGPNAELVQAAERYNEKYR